MSSAALIAGGGWAGGLPTGATAPVTPIAPSFASWVLQYIQPLQQWRDELLGDPGQATQVAQSWRAVEAGLVATLGQVRSAESQLQPLQGRTIRVLKLRYEDLRPTVEDAAEWSRAIAAAAELSASIVTGVRTFVDDFLRQLANLVDSLFGFTLNPFEMIDEMRELVAAVRSFVHSGVRLIQRMFDAFAKLMGLIASLGPVIESALTGLRELIARMMPAVGLFAMGVPGYLVAGAASDLLMDSGPVKRHPNEADLLKKSEATLGKDLDLSDLVRANGLTDNAGGESATAIDIKLVRDANGNEHWVVSLPSTLQWLEAYGSGAMNDGTNNVALMLLENPVLKTQYERAVLQAMKEAGMSPGDPVVFTGFSQGGIMAANLAADTTLPYKTIGVVTNGSPIDTFNIPKHIPVVAFEHVSDPVAKLDGNIIQPTQPNVDRRFLPDPTGNPFDVLANHDASNYADSVRDHAPDLMEQYDWMGGTVVDHQVFSATER